MGRPWNKVFAEICAHINRNSAVQDHVRDHVDQYVATHVILINGIPCSGEGSWHHGTPLHRMGWVQWYVCPRSGLLKRVRAPAKRPKAGAGRNNLPPYVRVSATLQCRLIDGAWYLVTLRPLPPSGTPSGGHDVVMDRPAAGIDSAQARKHYGAAVYAVEKRRLARRELRQLPIPVDAWV